jgi:DNA repair protein RadD
MGNSHIQTTMLEPDTVIEQYRLRDYQTDLIDRIIKSLAEGFKKILVVLPTGGGKTVVIAEFVKDLVEKIKNVLFLAHRRELIFQGSEKLESFAIDHGIIMSGEEKSLLHSVQVASIQTLAARIKRNRINPPMADTIIVDEGHHATATTYLKIFEKYPEAAIIGFTATPCRKDGRGLGAVFETLIEGPSISELTGQGHLVGCQYYSPTKAELINLKGLQVQRGDYSEKQLAERIDTPEIIGDIVSNFARVCPDRKAIVYTVSIKQSIHVQECFEQAGFKCAHLDGNTDKKERDAILKQLKSGDIQIITNCQVLTEGWDCPEISCCILARPTKSFGLYLQMVGRVLRPFPGKNDAIILDHSGAVHEHGFIDEDIPWGLEPGQKVKERKAKVKNKPKNPTECKNCQVFYRHQRECPNCGWKPEIKGKVLNILDGELKRMSRDGIQKERKQSKLEQDYFLAELTYIQKQRGYKSGWVSVQYKNRYGCFPKWGATPKPLKPSHETLAFIRRENQKYAQQRTAAH